MQMNIRLMKAFPKGEMKVPSHFIDFKWSMNVASFSFFIFYLLDKTFSFALNVRVIYISVIWVIEKVQRWKREKTSVIDSLLISYPNLNKTNSSNTIMKQFKKFQSLANLVYQIWVCHPPPSLSISFTDFFTWIATFFIWLQKQRNNWGTTPEEKRFNSSLTQTVWDIRQCFKWNDAPICQINWEKRPTK